jgi:hypothetical protein
LDSGFRCNISLKEDIGWRERYRQLSLEERSLLQTQLVMGLQRARSTITREMLRNGRQPAAAVSWQSRRWGNGGYLARTADWRAQRLHALPRWPASPCAFMGSNPSRGPAIPGRDRFMRVILTPMPGPRGSPWTRFSGTSPEHPHQPVAHQADPEIHRRAPIELVNVMLRARRQISLDAQVNRIPGQYSNQGLPELPPHQGQSTILTAHDSSIY